jgi:hypothetical protein
MTMMAVLGDVNGLHLDLKTFRILSVSLVILHLEYANPVWNPYLKKHIDMIENIQRRATKLIPGLSYNKNELMNHDLENSFLLVYFRIIFTTHNLVYLYHVSSRSSV